MQIPKNCLECISKGNYPCNDCVFRFPSDEIYNLFERVTIEKDSGIKKIEAVSLDTS